MTPARSSSLLSESDALRQVLIGHSSVNDFIDETQPSEAGLLGRGLHEMYDQQKAGRDLAARQGPLSLAELYGVMSSTIKHAVKRRPVSFGA